MSAPTSLPSSALRWRCDLGGLGFETTADLPDEDVAFAQPRAVEALELGVGIRGPGYNLYVLGATGYGKHTFARRLLEKRAAGEAVPPDVVYVMDFDQPHKPRALELPPGRGAALQGDMNALVEELRAAIPGALESEEYENRRKLIAQEVEEKHEEAFGRLQKRAGEQGIALLRTPLGFAFAPWKDGEVLDPDEFGKLPEKEQKRVKKDIEGLQEELEQTLRQSPIWQREAREKLRELREEVTRRAVEHLIRELRARYEDLPQVAGWLEEVERDVVANAAHFEPSGDGTPDRQLSAALRAAGADDGAVEQRYRVNLFVDRREDEGAPVVYEDHPVLENLVGRVEHRARFGALVTDHTLVMAGALHKANGGYLVLDARRVLTAPYAYEALKRALRSGEIRIQSLGQALGLAGTVSLEPEPVPLEVKIVLVGERRIYYLLSLLDPEFTQLFKVAADFDDEMERSEETLPRYVRQVASVARGFGLRPLARAAVERVLERAAREADDQHKLSLNVEAVADLLREADHLAGEDGADAVGVDHVQGAIDAARRRADRLQKRTLEAFEERLVLLETTGAAVGQVNGLSVLQVGHVRFGRPSRITARTRLGDGKVVDIEREVELGGPIHSKGVLILGSYLASRYATDHPLSFRASLVFEQSYGGVDGDSASLAELCALVSSLSGVPLSQAVAVTGSINQMGEVQPIGGVNEKIEGFFDVCRQRGLDGTQGVLIPKANERHLMLRHDVVEAVEAGRFRVWSAARVDEALALLTGADPGEAAADGAFPEDSVNGRVATRLRAFAEAARDWGKPPRGEGEGKPAPPPAAPEPPPEPPGGPPDPGEGDGP